MPSRTFFNLPERKRVRLTNAARAEFARVPFSQTSINRIIREAEISRGSFYQYFTDKHDLLEYLLADYRKMLARCALSSLKMGGGDLFQMFLDILDLVRTVAEDGENGAFLRNLFSDVRMNADFLDRPYGDLGLERNDLIRHVDQNALDIRSDQDVLDMLSILLALTGEAAARIFLNPAGFEADRERYAARLTLLKRGFLKEKAGTQCLVTSP